MCCIHISPAAAVANHIKDKLQSTILDEVHIRLLAPISRNRLERNINLDFFFFMIIWNYLEISSRNQVLKKAGIIQTGPSSQIFGTEISVQP